MMRKPMNLAVAHASIVLALCLAACSGTPGIDDASADAALLDAGESDGGVDDAGATDASFDDAGAPEASDAGQAIADAGSDAGSEAPYVPLPAAHCRTPARPSAPTSPSR